ncbi:hypothetical protein C823_001749 [Eubacterium plexicaudatum ASF492]|nr:hypothetical protein C823_001749 [Eubacterium plexicaudatum ASF492]
MEHIENNSLKSTRTWRACGYVRLSHEDGDKEESNSVTGQKNLIRDYFSRHPELSECGMAVDDGFSGSSFERPAFQKMMDDVRARKIDCIVVKDLSRFGRNYLDAGEYIEKIFPFLGVRLIAVNDNYDSMDGAASNELVVPFKNLINEAYCRDSSVKIRSCLEVKRRNGDFIGSFAVYGYLKDPQNKNHLVVDGFAADVVRDIFQWKLEGISAADIAARLNADGILAPMDYKKQQGLRFATPFRVKSRSPWSATSVLRILKNSVYMGVLEQGKNTTPSYKVKKRVERPRGEWAVVENAHEAVVDRQDFFLSRKFLPWIHAEVRAAVKWSCFPAWFPAGSAEPQWCGKPFRQAGKSMFIMYARRTKPKKPVMHTVSGMPRWKRLCWNPYRSRSSTSSALRGFWKWLKQPLSRKPAQRKSRSAWKAGSGRRTGTAGCWNPFMKT